MPSGKNAECFWRHCLSSGGQGVKEEARAFQGVGRDMQRSESHMADSVP